MNSQCQFTRQGFEMATKTRILCKFLASLSAEMFYQYSLQFRISHFMEHFFKVWGLIHQSHRSTVEPIQITAVKLIILFTLIRSAQFTFLTVTKLNDYWRILLWDQMFFQGGDSHLNFCFIFYGLIGIYIYVRIHFLVQSPRRSSIRLIIHFLDRGDTRFGAHNRLMQVSHGNVCEKRDKIVKCVQCFVVFWSK